MSEKGLLPVSRAGERITVALSGYATLDFVMMTAAESGIATGTSLARVVDGGWPRAGGAALYAARQLAASGIRAAPIASIGADANGAEYLRQCIEAGVVSDGIVQIPGARTPVCLLAYHRDGSFLCLLDTGDAENPSPDAIQARHLSEAAWVVIAAGPPAMTTAVLSMLRPEQRLVWILKDDPYCFPEELRRTLSGRADYVFCNRSERALVDDTVTRMEGRAIVETRGADGVLIECRDQRQWLPVEGVETDDTTGAGDTLVGATLVRLIADEANVQAAVTYGIEVAGRMLASRVRP